MKQQQLAFTLIELLITVAIVAILSATALPIFSAYALKTQVARVYSEAHGYTKIIEYHAANGTVGYAVTQPADELGFIDSTLSSVSFGAFTDSTSSFISAIIDGQSSAGIHGTEIRLTRNDNGSWSCTVTGSGSGWDDSLKPKTCN